MHIDKLHPTGRTGYYMTIAPMGRAYLDTTTCLTAAIAAGTQFMWVWDEANRCSGGVNLRTPHTQEEFDAAITAEMKDYERFRKEETATPKPRPAYKERKQMLKRVAGYNWAKGGWDK